MKKYWHVVKVGMQNNLTYRFNYLARTLFSFIPLMAMLYLWRTIYAGKTEGATISSYSLAQMISYYLLVAVVDTLTAVNEDDWQIAADIKDGNISQFLLKPIDYLWYRLCLFGSGRLTCVAVAVISAHALHPLPGATLCCSGERSHAGLVRAFAGAHGAAAILHVVHHGNARVLGAGSFDVYFHPLRVRIHCQRPPVPARHSAARSGTRALLHAVSISALFSGWHLHGKIAGAELARGLVTQLLWVVFAYGLARLAWWRGIRKYAAVGG